MLRRVLIGLAMVVLASGVHAQAKPDFSGRWTRVAPAGEAGARGAGGSDEVTLKQSATTVEITQLQAGTARTFVYNLDGSPSTNTFAGRQGAPSEIVSRLSWAGQSLVIDSTLDVNAGGSPLTITVKQVVSLDSKGLLTIDTTTTGMPGGQAMTGKAQYKKN
jgi:hypothetical protein